MFWEGILVLFLDPCSVGCCPAILSSVAICHKDVPRRAKVKPGPRARARVIEDPVSPPKPREPNYAPGTHHARTRGSIFPRIPITLVMVCDTLRTRRKYSSRDLHGALWGIDSAVRGWRLAAEKKPAEPRIAVQRAGLTSSAPGPLWGAKGDPRFAGVVGREPGGQPCYASLPPTSNPHLV